ncbi:MAG: hypothetical protein GJ680_07375 [Alteromonadaceae bacterium]|nr:hypothetical protein [Alteromonadaceae bacterium]
MHAVDIKQHPEQEPEQWRDASFTQELEMLQKNIELLVAQATNIISGDWDWMHEENHNMARLNKQLLQEKQEAANLKDHHRVALLEKRLRESRRTNIGPRLEKIRTTNGDGSTDEKYRPIWQAYPYSPKRTNSIAGKTIGVRIKMTNNHEYRLSTLGTASASWDYPKIIETEKLLMPIREKLSALHKAKVELRKCKRRVVRITKKYQQES